MRGHILIIDDEKEVFEDLKYGLGSAHDLHYAKTLSRVNNYLNSYSIDLVFVDLNMKIGDEDRFSGIHYIKALRTKHPTLTIVVLSGYSDESLIVQATKNGADDYLVKDSLDIDSDEFRDRVRKWINTKKKIDQKRNLAEFAIWGIPAFSEEVFQKCMAFAKEGKTFLLAGEAGLGKRQLLKQTYVKSRAFKYDKEPDYINLTSYKPKQIEKFLKLAPVKGEKNFLLNPEVKVQYIYGLETLSLLLQETWLEVIQSRKFIGKKDILNHQLIFVLEKDPDELMKVGRLSPALISYLPKIVLKPLRERRTELRSLIKNWQRHNGLSSLQWSQESLKLLLRYPFPGNISELYPILGEATNAHKKQFPLNWELKPIQPESLPVKIQQTPSDLFDRMNYEVARVHLTFIEEALIAYAGDRGQKDLAAKALNVNSADNMKKTFISRYWKLYPELVKGFPTIMTRYKLDNKNW